MYTITGVLFKTNSQYSVSQKFTIYYNVIIITATFLQIVSTLHEASCVPFGLLWS